MKGVFLLLLLLSCYPSDIDSKYATLPNRKISCSFFRSIRRFNYFRFNKPTKESISIFFRSVEFDCNEYRNERKECRKWLIWVLNLFCFIFFLFIKLYGSSFPERMVGWFDVMLVAVVCLVLPEFTFICYYSWNTNTNK